MHTRHSVTDSPLGPLTLVGSHENLIGVYFRNHWHPPAASTLGSRVDVAADDLFSRTAAQINEYLANERTEFDLAATSIGEPRQRRIWRLLTAVSYGETTTYGELAAALADGTTAYDVGQAVGRNPLSIVVPCHRVVGRGGALTGYAGGLKRKRFLLDLEAQVPAAAGGCFDDAALRCPGSTPPLGRGRCNHE
jgi:methylated-DNA-[protein]-cysteine S-methyltransferase